MRWQPWRYDHASPGGARGFVRRRVAVLFVLIAYLVAGRVRLNRFIKTGRKLPWFYRYFSAFVETSCPPVELLLAASYIDPAAALSMPPVLIYPLFIALSAPRLNFKPSVFTGAVAALEYTLVASASWRGWSPRRLSGGCSTRSGPRRSATRW